MSDTRCIYPAEQAPLEEEVFFIDFARLRIVRGRREPGTPDTVRADEVYPLSSFSHYTRLDAAVEACSSGTQSVAPSTSLQLPHTIVMALGTYQRVAVTTEGCSLRAKYKSPTPNWEGDLTLLVVLADGAQSEARLSGGILPKDEHELVGRGKSLPRALDSLDTEYICWLRSLSGTLRHLMDVDEAWKPKT